MPDSDLVILSIGGRASNFDEVSVLAAFLQSKYRKWDLSRKREQQTQKEVLVGMPVRRFLQEIFRSSMCNLTSF